MGHAETEVTSFSPFCAKRETARRRFPFYVNVILNLSNGGQRQAANSQSRGTTRAWYFSKAGLNTKILLSNFLKIYLKVAQTSFST